MEYKHDVKIKHLFKIRYIIVKINTILMKKI